MTQFDTSAPQLTLWEAPAFTQEDPAFLTNQLITYIGNKRTLLPALTQVVAKVAADLGRDRLRILDGFAGSGVVSRMFKSFASHLTVNDQETYARIIGECFLSNRSEVDLPRLEELVARFNSIVAVDQSSTPGFFERLYAPADDSAIQRGERVFYTRDNARRLDLFRQLLEPLPPQQFNLLLGPLLSSASVHANTAGVFKGFYKDKTTGIGKLGGSGADALDRITGRIELRVPVLSRFDAECEVHQRDTNDLVREAGDFDLAYFDPPYNQHPYGSNYFMLNLLASYEEPTSVSEVSGIPDDWRRSAYNVRKLAFAKLKDAILHVDARFVMLSFNDEGFVPPKELRSFLTDLGPVDEIQLRHNTFRGSRNLGARSIHVTEHLFLVKKGG